MKQEDIYKDNLKALFNDFEAPVPHDGWEKLEQSLGGARRVKLIRRNWYIGSVAAVAAILVAGILFLNTPKLVHQTSEPILTESKTPHRSSITSENDITAADKIVRSAETIVAAKRKPASASPISKKAERPTASKTTKLLDDQSKGELLVSKLLTERETNIADNIKESIPSSATSDNKQIRKEEMLTQEEIDRLIMEFANAGNTDIFGKDEINVKPHNPVMLALNGRGGLSGSQTVANSPMTLRSATAEPAIDDESFYGSFANSASIQNDNGMLLTKDIANNIAEMDHSQPVSVGITVSKNIIDRLSIETGLVYTYLYSKARNSSTNYFNQEVQDFHYLGIPLNFNYTFASIGNLDLFATMGGMVEKDIHGEYRNSGQRSVEEFDGISEQKQIKKIKQDNFQYSINAGFGISYPIYGRLNLYAKFGGSYYFDAKNSYKTIYSDKPIMLDLNAGIRFDF